MGVKVRVVKDRTKAYRKTLDEIASSRIRFGVIGAKAAEPHKDHDNKPGPLTVAEVAVIHEFGAGDVPMRSFIRVPLDTFKGEAKRRIVRHAQAVVSGDMRHADSMDDLGKWAVSLLADGIRKGLPVPPLDESTKRQRRGKVYIPLFDTGQLANSISYEVIKR